jgi:hypothetical protein
MAVATISAVDIPLCHPIGAEKFDNSNFERHNRFY